jgi:hypothetical protein
MSTLEAAEFTTSAPPRIIGTECEYAYQGASEEGLLYRNDDARHIILGDIAKELGLEHCGQFISNGARLYPDVGHLEYATPECLGPRQAVAADFAGTKIMHDVIDAYSADTGNSKVRLFRNTGTFVKPTGHRHASVTRGFHENYQVPRKIASNVLVKTVLPSFFVSRVWSGSGAISNNGYMFSQKAPGIDTTGNAASYSLVNRTFQGQKPMFVLTPPDDIYIDEDAAEWCRLEVRLADAGHSMDAQFLAKAATSLVLRLIEHGDEYAATLSPLALRSPGSSARIFGKDLSLKDTASTVDGRALSALNIQEIFLEQVRDFSEKFELPADEQDAIVLWEETLTDLQLSDPLGGYYTNRLLHRFDFAARHHYLAKREGLDNLSLANVNALHRSFVWDRVYPEGGAPRLFRLLGSEYVTNEEVDTLVNEPPQQTRAKTRADAIHQAEAGDIVNWSAKKPSGSGKWESFGDVYIDAA